MTPEKDETAPRLCKCGHYLPEHFTHGCQGCWDNETDGLFCETFDPAPAPGPGASDGEALEQAVRALLKEWNAAHPYRGLISGSVPEKFIVALEAALAKPKAVCQRPDCEAYGEPTPHGDYVPAPVPPPVGAEGKGGQEPEWLIVKVGDRREARLTHSCHDPNCRRRP